MTTTTVVALDGAISTTDASWPLLAYDDQVNLGTMFLWDPSIAAQWPTSVIGGAVASGDAWKNLGENFADGIQQVGVQPAYSAAGAQFGAGTTGSIYWPAGLFDLAALGWPNFHLSMWGKLPANPTANGTHRLFGFGDTAAATAFGAWYAYNASGPVLGLSVNVGGAVASAVNQAPLIGQNICLAITSKDAGDGARMVNAYLNNGLLASATLTPTLAAQPTKSFGLGKATSAFASPDDANIARIIMENCSVSGFDPEVRRAAEWKAQHARFGL